MHDKIKTRSALQAIRRLLISAPDAIYRDLQGRTAIVTGCAANSIGFETAKTLARWGATVVITTRAESQLLSARIRDELKNEGVAADIHAHALDLAQAGSVTQFVAWYRNTYGGQLDILVSNAGIHLDLLSQWKTPRLSADGFEIQWRTNYLGTMHLTHLLLPLLQNAGRNHGDARIVNVVSQLHEKGKNADLFRLAATYNSWTAYGTSKLGLVHASYEIQRRYAINSGLQAYCLHPGAVFTGIADKGLAGNPKLESMRKAMAPIEKFFLMTPEEGAQTSIHCATQSGLEGGRYFSNCEAEPSSIESQDAAISEQLWKTTEAWVKRISEEH